MLAHRTGVHGQGQGYARSHRAADGRQTEFVRRRCASHAQGRIRESSHHPSSVCSKGHRRE
eukprot:2039664-Prymnesium_polylepis.1